MKAFDYESCVLRTLANEYEKRYPDNLPKGYFKLSLKPFVKNDSVAQDKKDLLKIALGNIGNVINIEYSPSSLDYIKFFIDSDNVRRLYSRLGEKTPCEKENDFFSFLSSFKTDAPKLSSFISSMVEKRKTEFFDVENIPEARSLLKLAEYSEIDGKSYFIREISAKVLGDSKAYERQRLDVKLARLMKLVNRENLFDEYEDLSDALFLEKFGFYRYPEIFELAGPLYLRKNNCNILDFSFFSSAGMLSSLELGEIDQIENRAKRAILFENKASYYSFLKKRKKDELAVFEAGFLSMQRRILLSRIYKASDGVEFFHSGDIDAGGFDIFLELREIIPDLKPMDMDGKTLVENEQYAISLTENDRKRLERRLIDKRYSDFWPVISLMLEKNIKLEQENLL